MGSSAKWRSSRGTGARLLLGRGTAELDHSLVGLTLDRVARQAVEPLGQLVFEREPEQQGEERVVRLGSVAEVCCQTRLQLEPVAGFGISDAELEESAQQLAQGVVRNVLCIRHPCAPRNRTESLQRSRISATRRLLPIPASPVIATIAPLALREVAHDLTERG